MCGRYTQTNDIAALVKRFGVATASLIIRKRFNMAPGQDAPVIINDNGKTLKLMRWGLIPFWAKDEKIGYKMINARAETVAEKPAYKNSFKRKRCLIPADGFYEWRREQGQKLKIPMRFCLSGMESFAFAGLWDSWKKPDGEELETYTIITTAANELLGKFHLRMPVILDQENEDVWLNSETEDPKILLPFLKAYPAGKMLSYDVSTIVNSARNDTPECIECLEKE
jgi:putative SOS response-associated peptidase YedK